MGKRSNPASRLQMSDTNGLSDHVLKVEIHPPKKPKIAISDIVLDGSLLSPTLSEESFEKELKRARKEFQQFTNDLDKISKRVEKLAGTAPEWFADIEEIKIKQDNVEECITATQEKIFENEQRLEQLETVKEEFNEDINKDLKKIQEQLVELLERHREARSTASMIAQNQSMTTEELDLMLEAIRDYARLIEDASSTIKHFDDVGSPLHYESLDLSPFRTFQGNISYFDDHVYYTNNTTPTNDGSYPSSPIRAPSPISPLMLPSLSIPPMSDDESSDLSSPSTPIDLSQQPIYPSPYYLLRHQQLLLLGMRRAAVGLKFLLYAKRLNELEKKHPNVDYDSDWYLGMREDELESYDSSTDIDACSSKSERENKAYNRIRKKSLVLHSYDLLRFDKRTVVK